MHGTNATAALNPFLTLTYWNEEGVDKNNSIITSSLHISDIDDEHLEQGQSYIFCILCVILQCMYKGL